ncbi:MAG: filamentous hemagglutinin family protein, partial [Aquamicrobium sp.]|nr:filamentous hemagglutinin family protein [Aquamicrobium sp.]
SVNRELWKGADLPTEFTDGDRIKVAVKQNEQKAILTWDTFNVGGQTDLTFQQQAGNWVALNRVLGTDAKPSQILGSINASGQVYVINQNGIVFGGTSQVNVGALIASTAKIDTQKFLDSGIYSSGSGRNWVPSFTDAAALLGKTPGGGVVKVEAGARITTRAPASVTAGGGFVLLMGGAVDNAGAITTPNGQTQLAAGDDFVLRRGYGTDANLASTTRGNEIAPLFKAGSSAGLVRNAGIIFSPQGDITLAGRTVEQNGILVASTSVNTRGTIHLLNSATDKAGSVTLGAGSVTTIIPELESKETALNSQRDALIKASAGANAQRSQSASGSFDNLSLLADRLDQSRIEIVSGGNVVFKGGAAGSLTIAQGGQTAVSAGGRIVTEGGATIDVSGVRDVVLAMATNNLKVNIQGNELRDSPANRDKNDLKNKDVWVDIRDLIYVPAGTGGYDADRYYTRGGLLEVGGYLTNTAHSIGEWSTVGGTITLAAAEVVAQAGSIFDISGGSLKYESGAIRTTNFLGRDGRLYNIDNARADMVFYGLGQGHVREHARWGFTEVWTGPFGRGREHVSWEAGYTVGRDAGQLVLSAPTAVFEGNILADVVTGTRQRQARPDGTTDGYKLGQTQVAKAGQLLVGSYGAQGRLDAHNSAIVIGDITGITKGLDTSAALPSTRNGTLWFDAGHLNAQKLGGLDIATRGKISIERDLTLADGGSLNLVAPIVDFKAGLTARSGSVSVSNILKSDLTSAPPMVMTTAGGLAQFTLHGGATIDTRGQWTNTLTDPADFSGLAHVDGGSVSFTSTQNVILASGSRIDVSSGATLFRNGTTKGGKGGDIAIEANVYTDLSGAPTGRLVLDAELRGYGFEGGGKLSVGGSPVLIADHAAGLEAGQVFLKPDFFRKGFSQYTIKGSLLSSGNVTVANGTMLSVEMPVYRSTAAAHGVPTGIASAAPFEIWTPPLYSANPAARTIAQRKGASLAFVDVGDVSINTGSRIEVDPGQTIAISALGQITIDGRLNAFGGAITINNVRAGIAGIVPGRSMWIGDNAVLDVAARAVTALDQHQRPFARVSNGGTIKIGVTELTPNAGGLLDSVSPAFVIIRPGAILDASGAHATIDLATGDSFFAKSDVRTLSSHGGSITLASSTGLALDGEMRAFAGGAGVSGGSLNVILESGSYTSVDIDAVKQPRILTISQARRPSSLPTDLEPGKHHGELGYSWGRLSAEQVQAGGFDNLSLWSADILRFEGDVSLRLDQSLILQRGVISAADATPNAHIALSAPVVRFDGAVAREISSNGLVRPFLRNSGTGSWRPAAENTARLTVDADLIDVGNWVRFGVSDVYDIAFITHDQTAKAPIEAPGFSHIHFNSRGDIRFRTGSLASAGDLTLTSTQLYPVTGASATILAGASWDGSGNTPRPNSTLAIGSNGKSAQTPSSIFGALGLVAGTIEQDGVLRAPLGSIRLGGMVSGGGLFSQNSDHVVLRDGSITSVSAAGLVLPYGGTVDGLKYNYNGRELSPPDLMALDAMGKIEIASGKFVAESGSVLDLSGGGELAGAGFVAGRGGSVNILRTPLSNANPAFAFSAAGNKVYAILPGNASDYAPLMQETGAGDPAIGQQITIPAGIPGLPAGTYTLLPSTFALLPGAYRVEIGGSLPRDTGATALGNGSYAAGAYLGVANTAIRAALPNQIVVTPGTTVRTHSQFNETSYSSFALEQAGRFGTTRARLPIDGKQLILTLEEAGDALDFKGTALFAPGKGGYAGSLLVQGYRPIEIRASGAPATAGMIALDAEDLSRFDAGTLFVGGSYSYVGGGTVYLRSNFSTAGRIVVRAGAVVEAGQIVLAGNNVSVEDGAILDTTRSDFAVPDSTLGYVFANGSAPDDVTFSSVLMVANGWLNLLPAVAPKDGRASQLMVADGAILRTRGTVGFVAADQLSLGQAQLNARYLALSLPAVNVGTEASLAAAEAAGVLGTGWNLTQTTLDRLLNPATTNLASLERLSFSARDGINFYGNVMLDARNHAGGSARTMVVLNTPAIYGWGDSGTSAVLAADTLVWNGIASGSGTVENPYTSLKPPAVRPGGAGTGLGHLTFNARAIHFGYDPLARSQSSADLERLVLGFSGVDMIASEKMTANNRGIVSFYQSGTDAASYAGGNLTITTPLFTADGGAMIDIRAGGEIRVRAAGAATAPSARSDLGGEIRLKGSTITLDTTVALPSGRLIMGAQGDIVFGDRAIVDLAGRAISFYEVKKYSWGGSLEMESSAGRIIQAAGSVIDVSARSNNAGSVKASATNGTATFDGVLRGETGGGHDAGGFSLSANIIGNFADLNAKLNSSGFFGERRFVTKSGDITVGGEVRARVVNISADGGSLIVNDKIDASGERVGTIRLAARDGLTLASGAILDAHGTVLQVDSHGAPIEASNRASIELTTKDGIVTLAEGATIDLRSADGIARGKLEINAPRVGNDSIALDAAKGISIRGAASIAVNGFRSYSPADGIINQAYLDGIHIDSDAFINAASLNGALQAQLAGLRAYGSAYRLRPGVEITNTNDLSTQGDLDLSGYRYGSSVDPGVLVVRTGGNLKINGNINDGFVSDPDVVIAPMLAPGSLSWSMRFVSGADLAASDKRSVKPMHVLGETGDLVLENPHAAGDLGAEGISVVRTGTGYLDLIAGRNYRHASLYGVYTAGTASAETQNYSGIWLPDGGGDVRVEAGGTLAGNSYMTGIDTNQRRINGWLRSENGAWGINFGAYLPDSWGINELAGFAGIGALGGGNVHVASGGDAGVMSPQTLDFDTGIDVYKASGLEIAIGGGGYLDPNGTLRQTGGGDLVMKIGGRLNTAPLFKANQPGGGMLVNVRGDISVTASAIGLVSARSYGRPLGYSDPRPIDPTRAYDYRLDSGLMLALGDSRATINTRGNLVILHATDPGATDPASADGTMLPSMSAPGFSLWTRRSAIDLFSAGGSVAPISSYDIDGAGANSFYSYAQDITDRRPYPPALGVVAAGGNVLIFGQAELKPLSNARLDLLARDSIHYGFNPVGEGNYLTVWGSGHANNALSDPLRFYAVNGDITSIRTGYLRQMGAIGSEPLYIGGGPVWIRAGRDIIAGGGLDDPTSDWANEAGIGGLIVHSRDNDMSIIQAGRDIIYPNFKVGGPGVLVLTAGRHIYQADSGSLLSLGAVVPGDTRPGASIVMTAGSGANGPNYAVLLPYLDPANLAIAGTPLADQSGKVVKTYEKELIVWLKERYGYEAVGDEDARVYFSGLASEEQNVFLRSIYFAELREAGREYNNPNSTRFQSYLRGRQIIAALFPERDASGSPIAYAGDITMFGGSGVRTQFGGDIQMLAPGGQIVIGVEGQVPPSTAGIVTQGQGDIGLYSKGSILLGLSRIMTTFGGDIVAWSSEGDINAGRGAKTTVLYTPPKRIYDNYGVITLSPNDPSSGAGIATLNPIPEVKPGDIDLVAPLGTIDAGEAGIRFSGNVNVAALHVVNAANIQGQGTVTGVPQVVAPNIGGLTEAGNVAGAASKAAANPAQSGANEQPSIIIVEVLGFGGGEGKDVQPANPQQRNRQRQSNNSNYEPTGMVRVLGDGAVTAEGMTQLTQEERTTLASQQD